MMAPVKRKSGHAENSGGQKRDHGTAAEVRPPKKLRKDESYKISKPGAEQRLKRAVPKPQTPTATLLREEEPAFPRGGASILTPLEHKQIQIEAAQDVLFEQKNPTKSRGFLSDEDEAGAEKVQVKRANKKRKGISSKAKAIRSEADADNDTIRIEGLSYKVVSSLSVQITTDMLLAPCSGVNSPWSGF
jgi:rRNA biogenesis protein RRP5